ncbi:putative membrane protein [Exiguobacterium sp. S17]|nr:putative membrane protein [Exiguobacterium sp. S17]
MEIVQQLSQMQLLNQFWLLVAFIIPMVILSRMVVAGSRFSPILVIVIFGLGLGFAMVEMGIATPGLPEFPLVDFLSRTTIIALVVSFFVGGQELRKILSKQALEMKDIVVPSKEEMFLGTGRTQFIFIIRSFFLLVGLEGFFRMMIQPGAAEGITLYYPILALIGLAASFLLIDHKAQIDDKHVYMKKGLIETSILLVILFISYAIAMAVQPIIALPQIFFAMLLSSALGAIFQNWTYGPTVRALLFAGIPVVLAANFMVGGSRISDAFAIEGMNSVLFYGFFGQLFWMFGGIALLMWFARTSHIRNLAPGMAGSLSHSGLTGACTAGDFGQVAAKRAPIMINIPFFGHIFVFSILAVSADNGALWIWPTAIIVLVGLTLTFLALKNLRGANGEDFKEVKALMQFSFGWQIMAVFGGLVILSFSTIAFDYSAMAQSSAISHFGLFAAIQGGMFGTEASLLIPLIFSMPFLVHPLVFFMFGKALDNNGEMPRVPVYAMALIGVVGVSFAILGV